MEKETTIHLRVSQTDKELMQARANSVSLSLSAYTRKMLLEGQIHFIDPIDRRTINGIANNLNQLTRNANSTGVVPGEVTDVLEKLIKELRHAYGKR